MKTKLNFQELAKSFTPMGDGINYEQVAPEDVGALTSAPLISDGTNVYGYIDSRSNPVTSGKYVVLGMKALLTLWKRKKK